MKKKKASPVGLRITVKLLWTLIGAAAVILAVVLALTVFFKIDMVGVRGSNHTSASEIIRVSGVKEGDNLFLSGSKATTEKIISTFPYVEDVKIRRKLPDSFIFEVTEARLAAQTDTGDGIWLLSTGGKLLEKKDRLSDNLITVLGCVPADPKVGEPIDTGDSTGATVAKHLTSLEKWELLEKTDVINAEKVYDLTLTYDGRLTVELGTADELDYKIEYLASIIPNLEADAVGTVDLKQGSQAVFMPDYGF